MKKLSLLICTLAIAALSVALTTTPAAAACKVEKKPQDLSHADMRVFYDCIRPDLLKGYQKRGKNPIAMGYSDWQAASTAPAAPGFHSGQYLMTYVNPVGYADYVAFQTTAANMPLGTLIAKENFSLKKNGTLKKGALLMMEKVGLDKAADTGGWIYSGVKPNGKKLKVDQKGFCHACHLAWPGQDFLGYPIPAVRVSGG